MEIQSHDIGIIGLGALGSALIRELAARGQDVVGIDSFTPPHQHTSSSGYTRLFRTAYFEDARYIPLLKRARTLWMELGAHVYRETGLLLITHKRPDLCALYQDRSRQHESAIEFLSGRQLHDYYPYLTCSQNHQGIWEEHAGYINVDQAITQFLQHARDEGARLCFDHSVEKINCTSQRVCVITKKKKFYFNKVIVCLGPRINQLFRFNTFPITIHRAPQFWFTERGPDKLDSIPCFAFVDQSRFIYGFPNVAKRGVKVANYFPSQPVRTIDLLDSSCTVEELHPIQSAVREFLPSVLPDPIAQKLCFFSLSRDENFLLDRHPDYPQVYILGAGSGHSFKFAPVLAEIMAHDILGLQQESNIDFLRFRPL